MFVNFHQVLRPRCKVHRYSCLKSKFSCIACIPTSNDNILVGNSQLLLTFPMSPGIKYKPELPDICLWSWAQLPFGTPPVRNPSLPELGQS